MSLSYSWSECGHGIRPFIPSQSGDQVGRRGAEEDHTSNRHQDAICQVQLQHQEVMPVPERVSSGQE